MSPDAEPSDTIRRFQDLSPLPSIAFPPDKSLMITTCNAVSTWSASPKLDKIYRSVHDCIAAAIWTIQSTLAVADGRIVLLDDQKSVSKRYKLKSGDGHLCVLAYASRHGHLLFSTTLQYGILRYSIHDDRILPWSCSHPSPPSVLAVSVSSKYALSSSRTPPTVYLSLLDGIQHIQFKPSASQAIITAAAFHPDTEEHFLLAYGDGTVSIHTASRIVLMQTAGSDGIIGHMKRAHRTTNEHVHRHVTRTRKGQRSNTGSLGRVGPRTIGITAAVFVNGCKLRVVTVAGDGRCRLIDFGRGAQVLRSWSVLAPCTSLSIYSPTPNEGDFDSPIPRHIIAIGRADGYVTLFDYVGLFREERLVDSAHRKIIGLEWISNDRSSKDSAAKSRLHNVNVSKICSVEWKFANKSPEHIQLSTTALTRSPIITRGIMNEISRGVKVTETSQTPQTPSSGGAKLSAWPNSPSSSSSKRASPLDEASSEPKDTVSPPVSPRLIDSLIQPHEASPRKHAARGVPPDGVPPDETKEGSSPVLDQVLVPIALRPETKALDPVHSVRTAKRTHNRTSKRCSSNMPCSWVSGSEASSAAEEDETSHQQPTQVHGRAIRQPNGATIPNSPSPSAYPPSRGRLQQLPALSASTVSLADLSEGWESDGEESPSRLHEGNRQKRLRRMTMHDNLAKLDLSSGKALFHSSSQYSARPESPAPHFAIEQHPSEPRSSQSPTTGVLNLYAQSSDTGPSKPLTNMPPSYDPRPCDCDCADVLREEMALVRSEIASLRKAMWVFGSRVEAGGRPAMGLEAPAQGIGDSWGEQETRDRTRGRSSF